MMIPPRPDQRTDLPVPYAPGSRSGAAVQAGSLVAAGLAMDTTVQATNTALAGIDAQLVAGVPPAVAGYAVHSLILQPPGTGPYTLYTFTGAGRIWKATVTFSVLSATGTGANQAYAQVLISGGATLAIVEGGVAGNPDADSNTDPELLNGLAVGNGTVIELDVNNAVTPTGVVVRASGLIGVSIP